MRAFKVTGTDRSDYMVKDIGRAVGFYRDVLGLAFEGSDEIGYESVLPDGTAFGLWEGSTQNPPIAFQPGNSVMFGVDDFDAAVAAVKAAGATVATLMETPVCHIALVYDTEGNIVNLHRRKDAS